MQLNVLQKGSQSLSRKSAERLKDAQPNQTSLSSPVIVEIKMEKPDWGVPIKCFQLHTIFSHRKMHFLKSPISKMLTLLCQSQQMSNRISSKIMINFLEKPAGMSFLRCSKTKPSTGAPHCLFSKSYSEYQFLLPSQYFSMFFQYSSIVNQISLIDLLQCL